MAKTQNHQEMRIWTPSGEKFESRPVTEEVPVAIEYNCVTFAVMMASPSDLVDFSYGFSLTEKIIERASDIIYSQINETTKGTVAAIEINNASFMRLENYTRALTGRTGCGLCGVDKLDQAILPLGKVVSNLKIVPESVHAAMMNIKSYQVLNRETGALHAAAFMKENGDIVALREDVGRHNALDKLIGHIILNEIDPSQGYVLVTSRCSFEMVQKCAIAGIPMIAAVSATTGLAIKLAEEAGVTVIAFARNGGLNIVSDVQQRLL